MSFGKIENHMCDSPACLKHACAVVKMKVGFGSLSKLYLCDRHAIDFADFMQAYKGERRRRNGRCQT